MLERRNGKPQIKNVTKETTDNNYRPVSNLKHLSKILECAALLQIVHHCESNKLLPANQSAYRKGFSCNSKRNGRKTHYKCGRTGSQSSL